MRLLSAVIRHYRVHQELTLAFDPARTLIGGANECGKSTAIEAIHRALFLRAKITGDGQRMMVAHASSGPPEVEVVFEASGKQYHLIKRFSGASGSTRLVEAGGASLAGDEAEARLATLLGVEAMGGGRGAGERVAQQWAHLWVWQGRSGEDPTCHATHHRDRLIQRLQDSGGAAAMQSALDTRVVAHVTDAMDAWFVRDRAKAGSEWARAESAAVVADANLAAAAARLAKLQEEVRNFDDAGTTIDRAASDVRLLTDQLRAVEAKQRQLTALRQQEAAHAADAQTAAERCVALEQTQAQIAQLQFQTATDEAALAPKTANLRRLTEALAELRLHAQNSAHAYEAACETARVRRLRHELAGAWVSRFERAIRCDELDRKAAQVQALETSLADLRQQLAPLPAIDAVHARKLQKLESEADRADAALKAMAASIHVIVADQPVALAGESVAPGEFRVVMDDATLAIGDRTRIEIRPGGGTTLAQARQQAHDARYALMKALDAAGAASVAAANDLVARRAGLSSRLQEMESARSNLDAVNVAQQLAEATAASTAAEAEVTRRREVLPDFAAPAQWADARQLQAEEARQLSAAEAEERRTKSARDADGRKVSEAETALQEARQETERQTRELGERGAQLRLLIETHGSDDVRAQHLAEARMARALADQALAGTRRGIAELQPELLTADHDRLRRALTQTEKTRTEAETRRAVAQAALRSDGTDDPQAALFVAQAQVASAHEHLASVRRRAAAIRLLHQLFLDEQKALSERFTQPLAERISGYLQCVFGAEARATVVLAENAFAGCRCFVRTGSAAPWDSMR